MSVLENNKTPGIDQQAVTLWFKELLPSVLPPLTFGLISGGHSNLTYLITDASGAKWILRRPPLGELMPTAHDVNREYTVMAALQNTDVPVPKTIGFCNDNAITGAPFYIMSCAQGMVLHDEEDSIKYLGTDERSVVSESLVDTLIAFQNIDIDAVGLGDLGRREGYLARQLKRFSRNYDLCEPSNPKPMYAIHDELKKSTPTQGPATLVHGDYRLGNCTCSPCGQITAILDWETCTLGDPLIDISLMLAIWSNTAPTQPRTATSAPGFWTPERVLSAYAERCGRDVSNINYYLAFQFWRMSVIYEEIAARYRSGAYGAARKETDIKDAAEYYMRKASTVLDQL